MDLFSFYKSAYNQEEAQISDRKSYFIERSHTQGNILYGQAATTAFFMLQ